MNARIAVAAALAAAMSCQALSAEESPFPRPSVLVVSRRQSVDPFPALAQFDIPMPTFGYANTDTVYLIGAPGQVYACQLEPSSVASTGRTFKWIRMTALVPNRSQTLDLAAVGGLMPSAVLVVASQATSRGATLESHDVKLDFAADKFRFAESLSLFGRELMPRYADDLLNRQQSVELIVTDRYRHIDHVLRPEVAPEGFSLEKSGPVLAVALYKGRFAGEKGAPSVDFEARVSLAAHGVICFRVTIPESGLDRTAFAVKELRLTIPCVLATASTLDFGGFYENSLGPEHYEGYGALSVKADGSWTFADSKAGSLKGKAGISWADYNNGDAGLAFIFEPKKNALSITADYNEDIIEVGLTPGDSASGAQMSMELYMLAHGGRAGKKMLGHVSDCILNPPAVAPCESYIKAVTAFP